MPLISAYLMYIQVNILDVHDNVKVHYPVKWSDKLQLSYQIALQPPILQT